MKITEQLIDSREGTYSGTSACSTVTVHETANTDPGADAQAHANLQENNPRAASWHIQVDDTEAIRSYPDSARCWHAGDDAADSIAVEMCVNSDGDYDQTLRNAAEVVAQLCEANGLDEMNVVGHVFWTGKDCPAQMLGADRWDSFIDDVRAHLNGDKDAEEQDSAAASAGGDGTDDGEEWPDVALPITEEHTADSHAAWVKLLTDVGHRGAGDDLTRAMQNWLSGLTDSAGDPYYQGYIDSDFGELTTEALQRFLADRDHYDGWIDGDRGPMTIEAELKYLNDQRQYY